MQSQTERENDNWSQMQSPSCMMKGVLGIWKNPVPQTLEANSETNITNLDNPRQEICASTSKSRNPEVTKHKYTEWQI